MAIIDPNLICLYAEAVNDYGLCVREAVNGLGLETYGLIWQGPDIWIDEDFADGIITVWLSSNPVITTTWVSSQPVITTTWVESTVFGLGNEFPEA